MNGLAALPHGPWAPQEARSEARLSEVSMNAHAGVVVALPPERAALPAIEEALDVPVDASFPNHSLKRAAGAAVTGPEEAALYQEVCRRRPRASSTGL
jgi:hypothetical protein